MGRALSVALMTRDVAWFPAQMETAANCNWPPRSQESVNV